ncbi:histidinol dehydrogenase [Frankia canadensis]|uniref:Histidinol dehydrogenase n=1 Tax=Frankia canadensis TaxID=1836972 RepID=A0A2I2KRF0_9ACTN|nr:histidinol dehydrogenase [Frankia canadensis]SNQ48245.1 histidinol dehydrogenase [Frankia canadensis]SOU55535.1 histidinol dehydrogenase [Frankia canadensis]
MLRRLDLRGATPAAAEVRRLLPRAPIDVDVAVDAVRPVCDDVRARGDAAVLDAAERFDGVRPPALRVPPAALAAAAEALDPAVRDALAEAIRRARLVHRAQLREPVTIEVAPGLTVTERWVPVERVGLYVPGGRVAYPSSVVMNVVAAQEAGVASLAVFSPPQRDNGGLPHPVVLGACALLGIDEVYAAGGAQAIAMAAHGTASCPPVDVITGPGNVYVTAAKRLVRGLVGVDAEAGPTEVAILADHTADASFVAADLVAQAEHDPMTACLLVTTSVELADAVDIELGKQVPATRHRARVEEALAGQGAIALVADVDAGLAVVDAWAAEHLEIQTADAAAVAARVRHAGAVFVGAHTPVPLGDYLAGSNHVLPTGGTARHSGGLSVASFQRQVHLVESTPDALHAVSGRLRALAGAEDLTAHADAVEVRFR